MAGSTKTESTTNSFDASSFGSGFSNAQRGNLGRSGSFRNAAMPSVEIPHANQYMSLEPYNTNDLKNVRSAGELRRVLGVPLEDHLVGFSHSKPLPPVSWEELKKFKGNIEEVSSRAKDRVRSLLDSVLKLDRYRNLISRKRQRIENQLNDKSSNSNLSKMGSRAHQKKPVNMNPKLEERTRNGAPSKRARSSIAEAQATSFSSQNTPSLRQGKLSDTDKRAPADKDKAMLRACNGDPILNNDKTLTLPPPPAGLKRKRSLGLPQWNNTRIPSDGDREIKHSTNLRVRNDSHPRSSDGLGLRSGLSNGNAESSNCQLSAGSNHILPGIEFGNGLLSIDKRERTSLKGNYKLNISEGGQSGHQSSLTKGKASRPYRANSGVPMSSCKPNFPCASVATIDGTRWAGGQRSKGKNSNTRKSNVVFPAANLDDTSQSDDYPVCPIVESSGSLFSRDNIQNITPNLKSKDEINNDIHEVKRSIDNSEIEGRSVNVRKKATYVLPSKKKVTGDGIRRQGRSGRGIIRSKTCSQLNKEKSGDLDTATPVKSRKLISDKPERVGSPLSKKTSEHKGPSRCGQNTNYASLQLAGKSDDDREELLAAAKAVNDSKSLGPFWELVEPIFAPIKPEDVFLLKHQVTHNDERLANDMSTKETIPLSQRLLSSLITEEEIEIMDCDGKTQHEISHNLIGCSPCSPKIKESHSGFYNNTSCNEFASPINFSSTGNLPQENGFVENSEKQNAGIVQSEFIQDGTNHVQYENMSLDDKLLMELHSIGIYPDLVTDPDEETDNEIDKVLSELTIVVHQQMMMKNSQLCRLEKVILEQKEGEMRNLEQLAMNKLVEKAYNKLMAGRQKCGSGKASKQHALAFAKRAIARCHKFEETGQSCFREPFLRDVLFLQSLNENGNDTNVTAVISSVIAPNAETHDTQIGSQIKSCDGSPHNLKRGGSLTENSLIINKERNKGVADEANHITPTLQNGTERKQPEKDATKDSPTKNCTERIGTSSSEHKENSKLSETAGAMSKVVTEDAANSTMDGALDFPEDADNVDELCGEEDLVSWLNIVDDSGQETDFVGLQIPMDDLWNIELQL